jgi:hypothetical protein
MLAFSQLVSSQLVNSQLLFVLAACGCHVTAVGLRSEFSRFILLCCALQTWNSRWHDRLSFLVANCCKRSICIVLSIAHHSMCTRRCDKGYDCKFMAFPRTQFVQLLEASVTDCHPSTIEPGSRHITNCWESHRFTAPTHAWLVFSKQCLR